VIEDTTSSRCSRCLASARTHGRVIRVDMLPGPRPLCLRVVRPGGESEVKRPSGREWGSVLFGPIWKSNGYPTAKPSPSPLLQSGVERRFPCAFSPLSLTSLLPSVRVVQ